MDLCAIRQFADRISPRSLGLAVAGCALLAVPIIWTVRQSGLTHEALARAAAAEQAAAQARTDMEEARSLLQAQGRPPKDAAVRRSRHDDPTEIERVNKLYEEIDNLSRIREQTEITLGRSPSLPTRKVPPANEATP